MSFIPRKFLSLRLAGCALLSAALFGGSVQAETIAADPISLEQPLRLANGDYDNVPFAYADAKNNRDDGGAFNVLNLAGDPENRMENVIFRNYDSPKDGGAIWNTGFLGIYGTRTENADGTYSYTSQFLNNSGRSGGALFSRRTYVSGQNPRESLIRGTLFEGNRATLDGGAVRNYTATMRVEQSEFRGNHADKSGGALSSFEGTVTIADTNFVGNSAGATGGAIQVDDTAAKIIALGENRFEGNTAADLPNDVHIRKGTFQVGETDLLPEGQTTWGTTRLDGGLVNYQGDLYIANSALYARKVETTTSVYGQGRTVLDVNSRLVLYEPSSLGNVMGAYGTCDISHIADTADGAPKLEMNTLQNIAANHIVGATLEPGQIHIGRNINYSVAQGGMPDAMLTVYVKDGAVHGRTVAETQQLAAHVVVIDGKPHPEGSVIDRTHPFEEDVPVAEHDPAPDSHFANDETPIEREHHQMSGDASHAYRVVYRAGAVNGDGIVVVYEPEPEPEPEPDTEPEPEPPVVPDPPEPVIEGYEKANPVMDNLMSIAANNYLVFRAEASDLQKRLGDLRLMPEQNGGWARVIAGQSRYRGQRNTYRTIQGGFDHRIDDTDFIVGAVGSYSEGDGTLSHGKSDDRQYTYGAYLTWMGEKGRYLDLVAKRHHLESDYALRYDDGIRAEGDFHNAGTSLSAEYGRRFPLGEKKNYYLEPQAELTIGHLDSATYRTSNGVRIAQDGMDAIIGRLGIAIGWTHPEQKASAYLRASILNDWGGKARLTASKDDVVRRYREDMSGTWLEYGIGGTYNLRKDLSLYGELETAAGAPTRNSYQLTAGLRWRF